MKFRTYRLKDLGHIVTGKTPSKRNRVFYQSKDIMFIRPDDLCADRITLLRESKEHLSHQGAEQARLAPRGSVLVTCIGRIGKVGLLEKDGAAFNQQINAIIPHHELVNGKYLAYKLWSERKKLQMMADAAVVPIINKRRFSNFQVEIPPLSYQRKAVEVLDKAQELVDKRKSQMEVLGQLAQSLFVELFGDWDQNEKGWTVVSLEEIADRITDGMHSKPDYTQEGIPFISAKDINTGKLSFENCKFIAEETYRNFSARCKPEPGDILYTKVGTYGIPALVDKDTAFGLYVSVALIKPKRHLVNSLFLREALRSVWVKRQAHRSVKGIGVPDLHLEEIKKFQIILPPLKLQEHFAQQVLQIERQRDRMEKSLLQLEDNFLALMQLAFQGKLP